MSEEKALCLSVLGTIRDWVKDQIPAQTAGIPYGECDSTSTATAFTATVPGITELQDGTTMMLKNGVITSAANFTININNLGAKPCYNNMATGNDITPTAPTRDTTIFNQNYTMLFVYSEDIVDGGGWICYRGYDANTNTIGYQLRTNSSNLVAADTGYRYRIWLTSADGSKWVPINTSTSTNSTTARSLNTRAIDPFGAIVYRDKNGTCNSGTGLGATGIWQQYTLTIGYSYVLTMAFPAPVYLRCTPQSDGSAVMNDVVQALPSSNDGKIYIFLGVAYSATAMELQAYHPVYWHDGTGIRIWTGAASSGSSVDPATATPLMDGTGAVGTSAKYAREDHRHPTDTSRQATLVSGTNIKTVNNNSLLGSGNISLDTLPSVSASDNDKVLTVVSGAWAASTPSGGGGSQTTWYGTCDTTINAQTKIVNATGFTLARGTLISVEFTHGNSYVSGALMLNINNTGAKYVSINDHQTSAYITLPLRSNSVVTFMYDGAEYQVIGRATQSSTWTDVTDHFFDSNGDPLSYYAANFEARMNQGLVYMSFYNLALQDGVIQFTEDVRPVMSLDNVLGIAKTDSGGLTVLVYKDYEGTESIVIEDSDIIYGTIIYPVDQL